MGEQNIIDNIHVYNNAATWSLCQFKVDGSPFFIAPTKLAQGLLRHL